MSEPIPGGPQPARTDRPRPAALRVLRELVELPGATVSALTARLGGHPNSVRNQLEGLVEAGFAEARVAQSDGRGRPSNTYAATLAGQQVAAQDDHLGDQSALVEAVAEHLGNGPQPRQAAAGLGREWGRRLTTDPGAQESDLMPVLARQGFTPSRTPAGILLQTCPLLDAARRRPEVVCSIHQGMLEAVAGRPVSLWPFAAPNGCLVSDGAATGGVAAGSGRDPALGA